MYTTKVVRGPCSLQCMVPTGAPSLQVVYIRQVSLYVYICAVYMGNYASYNVLFDIQ